MQKQIHQQTAYEPVKTGNIHKILEALMKEATLHDKHQIGQVGLLRTMEQLLQEIGIGRNII